MRIPAGIVGLALVFWGWQSELLPVSFPFLVVGLAPKLIRRRFDFTSSEFHRALELCWVLLVGALLMVYGRETVGNVFRSVVRWLPVIVFPALMAQVWSLRGVVPANSLIPLPAWRRQVDPGTVFDMEPVYVAVCLLAASVSGPGRPWFYPGVVCVAGAGFWSIRARVLPSWMTAVVLGIAAVGGWFGSGGIGVVQQWTEARVVAMVSRWRSEDWASRSFRTAIGRSGQVGGSSQVVLRVRGMGDGALPRLLRVMVFSAWRGDGTWVAPKVEPEKVDGVGDEWRLDRRPGREGAVYVEWVPELTFRFLPLPSATRGVAELSASRVERTRLGAVRADVKGGVVSYRADVGTDANWEAVAGEDDMKVFPVAEVPALQRFAEEVGLGGLEPAEQVGKIGAHFQSRFRYTTELVHAPAAGPETMTPVGQFLHGSKAGHCEYFATASVLILRHLGVPARFATGYMVPTGERLKGSCVVREKQSHAWVRVWIDGAWRDFDPTPMGLFEDEAAAPGVWDRVVRGWHDFQFAMSRWWWVGEKRILRHAYWLAVPLIAGLLWRLRRVREASGFSAGGSLVVPVTNWPGIDSEWFEVARRLEWDGWQRKPGEAAGVWCGRLRGCGWSPAKVELTLRALGLHQRLRFDPVGLEPGDRGLLRSAAGTLLEGAANEVGISDGATRA